MCRDVAHGGRRCPRANRTRMWRTKVTERLARNKRVAQQCPDRAQTLNEMVERDQDILSRFDEAVVKYGECVIGHDIELSGAVPDMVRAFRREGLDPLLVGGSVRDSLLEGAQPKDLDFEVYGGGTERVAMLARKLGKASEVGQAFGVVKLVLSDGQDIDLAVPRRDNKVGSGHRGFRVDTDPLMTVSEASSRRDFTINAMSYDPRLGVLIDPHGGLDDLGDRVLRHVSPAFAEDPLRVLRAMQFAGRYAMTLHPDTASLCATLREEGKTLPVERVRGEWKKWASKSKSPSFGLRALHDSLWDRDVTGLVEANTPAVREAVDRSVQVSSAWGVHRDILLPAVVARAMSEEDARTFLNQAVEGASLQRRALAMSRPSPLPNTVEHAREIALNTRCTLRESLAVAVSHEEEGSMEAYQVAGLAGVLDGPEPDLLSGEDILSSGRRKPGPWVGKAVAEARLAQARGVFRDHDAALGWASRAVAES